VVVGHVACILRRQLDLDHPVPAPRSDYALGP
jgi:hypothetical protein